VPPVIHGTRPPEVSTTLERIAVLRSRGEYGEAARVLRRALAAPLRAESAEILSYELGSILTYQLDTTAAACAHWERHLERYPAGRFDLEVEESRAVLDCERKVR
jgi:transmembrane sensor